MKLDGLRRRFPSIAFVFFAAASAACEPVITFGQPQGEGGHSAGQGGQAGQPDAGGLEDAGDPVDADGSASSGGSGGAGGAGGAGGSVDAGVCTDGQMQSCFTGDPKTLGVGLCQAGTQICVNGMFGACIGEVTATAEVCNGLDDDCNGSTDDGNPGGGTVCNTGQPGVCIAGTTVCTAGVIVCSQNTPSSAEICDTIDNDCNGSIDDGNPGGGIICSTGQWGVCAAGTTVCTAGAIVCNQNTQSSTETCDNIDNDCNNQVDDGNPGGGTACNTGMSGVCAAGTTACTAGAIVCNATTEPTAEICDGLDNDCNGFTDDGNPGSGTACSTGQPGVCAAGTTTCAAGGIVCNQTTPSSTEICDNIDNDCDGTIDDGNPGGGTPCSTGQLGVCAAGTKTCTSGAMTCVPNTSSSPEVCDGIDNDCNGQVDEGNPGGGPPCVSVLAGCKEQMVVVNGTPVLLGTFVGPAGIGAPGNPGTKALPLSTIAAAQANAALMGGGADVCVCDTSASGSNGYTADVTMIEGISVLGGFNCADWSRAISTYVTTIRGKVGFPAGITSDTALDGLTVAANDIWSAGNPLQTSIAISIVNSSPSLVDVVATGGPVPRSYGLIVSAANGGTASPTVTRGSYYGYGVYDLASSQIAVSLNGASGTFTDVEMRSVGFADYSTGLRCSSCNATIVGGTISGGSANNNSAGLVVTGNSGGLSVTNTGIHGGVGFISASSSVGVEFNNCNGSPTLSAVHISGGGGRGVIRGIGSTGAQCAPVISGTTVHVGGAITESMGVSCTNNSPCVMTNSTITAGGSSWTNAAVFCNAGGCGTLSGNTISTGTIGLGVSLGVGLYVKDANPLIDSNYIAGPAFSNGTGSMPGQFSAAHFENSSSRITNNVVYDQPCNNPVDVVVLKDSALAAAEIYNNTIQFATCNGCGVKRGLFVSGVNGTSSVRNNMIINAGTSDFANGIAVYEQGSFSSLQFFENNDLWAPNGGTLYFDNGLTSLSLAGINALTGSGGNINADPQLDATFHIPMTSPCRNAGTAAGGPAFDFDGDTRPQEMSYDIGADEYVP